jgi:Outer membrane protein beta-barrel domain
MKKNLHDIDKLFKAALDEQEEAPSPGVWDAIDKHLDKNKVVDINKKYIQLKKVAAALLILLIGIGAYTLNTWNKHERLVKSNESKENRAHKNDTGILNNTKKEQKKIDLPDTVHEDNAMNNKALNNPPGQPVENQLETVEPADVNKNTVAQNAIVQNEKENSTTTGNQKITVKKRTYKTTITNAEIGEEVNPIVQNDIKENKIETENKTETGQLNALPFINPATLKAIPTDESRKKNTVGSHPLPNDLIAKMPPAKSMKRKKESSFAATVFYSPNFSSNTIKKEENDRRPGGPSNDRDRKKIREGEQHQSPSTVGVLLDFNFNKHWGIQSGLSITNKTINIEPKTIFARKDNSGAVKYLFDCSSGYLLLSTKSGVTPAVGDSIKALASTNTLQYLSVPFAVKYNYSFHKIDLFATAGAAVNILTKGKIETEIQNGLTREVSVNNKINGLKSNYLGGNVSIGAAFNITDRMALSFTPSYNFALTSSTQDAAVKSFPNSISLAAGLRFKL